MYLSFSLPNDRNLSEEVLMVKLLLVMCFDLSMWLDLSMCLDLSTL